VRAIQRDGGEALSQSGQDCQEVPASSPVVTKRTGAFRRPLNQKSTRASTVTVRAR